MPVLRPNQPLAVAGAVAIAILALALAVIVPATQASHVPGDHGGITLDPLTPARAQFTDAVAGQFRVKLDGTGTRVLNMRDPSRTFVGRITVPPGAHFPWHTHPGPVLVNVAEGALVYQNANDCVERAYDSGTAFIDPGRGNVHTAWNPSATETTVLIATFFEVPASGPLTITGGVTPGDC